MDPRRNTRPGPVNEAAELAFLRAGSEPTWERPHRDGVDITNRPDLQTPYQRARRREFEERVERYRADGVLDGVDSSGSPT
ncbi:hypothetical protein ACPW96_21705 [Micromonospora sp. DT81.3]|uniref:hypothetical protein n=1 Tax=Micromonospora sp. DT81.3 TaxID=3416523 RepID=UPI003CF88A22